MGKTGKREDQEDGTWGLGINRIAAGAEAVSDLPVELSTDPPLRYTSCSWQGSRSLLLALLC